MILVRRTDVQAIHFLLLDVLKLVIALFTGVYYISESSSWYELIVGQFQPGDCDKSHMQSLRISVSFTS